LASVGGLESWEAGLGTSGWWTRILLFGAAIGGTIGVIGFLSGDLLICLFDWTAMVVVGTGLAAWMVPALVRTGRRFGLPLPVALIGAAALAAAPIALFAGLFSAWAWPAEVGRMTAIDWYVKTLLVEAMIVGLWVLVNRPRVPASRPVPFHPAMASAEADPVTCLQMEDHYVRIHRGSGSRLELLPLTEAMARYGTAPGLRVHRGWWVAADAIAGVERDGRNLRLRLENGLVVPVARNRIAQLRALAGLDF
jgi:hypothetical protein